MLGTISDAFQPCSFCGASTAPFLEARDYNRGVSNDVFHYSKCTNCGVLTLVDAPEDIGFYYGRGYHEVPTRLEDIERRVKHERYKIELVKQFKDSGNLLEIGPSWGAFCLLAKRSGFSVEAIERDPQCCEFLRSRVQVQAVLSESEASALDQVSTPDVIAIWHAIEHMRDPSGLLARASDRLAPGGLLVIASPNPNALQSRLFGPYWAHLDAPRHMNLIPPEALCAKVKALGLNVLRSTTTDAGSLECNIFGWRKSLSNLVTNSFLKNKIYYWGRLVADVAGLGERQEGSGSAYTVIFGKPR